MEPQIVDATPTFKRHVDTEKLITYLQTVSVGQDVSYEALSMVIGRSIQTNRNLLETAKKHLVPDRYFFLTRWGEGIHRASDAEWSNYNAELSQKKIGRTAKKANHNLSFVVMQELNPEDKVNLTLAQTVLSIHEAMGRPKARNTIKRMCDSEGQRLQLKAAAEALSGIF